MFDDYLWKSYLYRTTFSNVKYQDLCATIRRRSYFSGNHLGSIMSQSMAAGPLFIFILTVPCSKLVSLLQCEHGEVDHSATMAGYKQGCLLVL